MAAPVEVLEDCYCWNCSVVLAVHFVVGNRREHLEELGLG